MLRDELVVYGFTNVRLDPWRIVYLVALLPSNPRRREVRQRRFIAHVDTADFNAENNPQIHENYNGERTKPPCQKNFGNDG